jgi:hypothetical protein
MTSEDMEKIYKQLIEENLKLIDTIWFYKNNKKKALEKHEEFIRIVKGKQNKLTPNDTLTIDNLKRIIVNNLRHDNEYNKAIKEGLTQKEYKREYENRMLRIAMDYPALLDTIEMQITNKSDILDLNIENSLIKD